MTQKIMKGFPEGWDEYGINRGSGWVEAVSPEVWSVALSSDVTENRYDRDKPRPTVEREVRAYFEITLKPEHRLDWWVKFYNKLAVDAFIDVWYGWHEFLERPFHEEWVSDKEEQWKHLGRFDLGLREAAIHLRDVHRSWGEFVAGGERKCSGRIKNRESILRRRIKSDYDHYIYKTSGQEKVDFEEMREKMNRYNESVDREHAQRNPGKMPLELVKVDSGVQ